MATLDPIQTKWLTMLPGKKAYLVALGIFVPACVVLQPADSYSVICHWSVALEVLRYSDQTIWSRPAGLDEFSWIMLAEVDSCTWLPTE
jgi:hypothetical protein